MGLKNQAHVAGVDFAAEGDGVCKLCTVGNYTADNSGNDIPINASHCFTCPRGYFCQDGDKKDICDELSFQKSKGQSSCDRIRNGYVGVRDRGLEHLSDNINKKGSTDERPCKTGHKCNNNIETPCTGNTYQESGGKGVCTVLFKGRVGVLLKKMAQVLSGGLCVVKGVLELVASVANVRGPILL